MRDPMWPDLLMRAVLDSEDTPFEYGKHDCMIWPANIVRAFCPDDPDPAADFRGRYATEIGAARILKREGGMAALMSARYEEVPPLCIRRGDFVLTETVNGETLGICVGSKFAVAQEPRGVRLYEMKHAVKGWKVE